MASEPNVSACAGSALSTTRVILISIVLSSLTAGHMFADSTENSIRANSAKAILLNIPLSFEANQGQTDARVKFP